jgi:hypothetical protein
MITLESRGRTWIRRCPRGDGGALVVGQVATWLFELEAPSNPEPTGLSATQ